MNDKRPVNLDLATFRWPITAMVSMPHRISGFVIFLAIPIVLWGLQQSLSSQESFDALQVVLDGVVAKLILWSILAGLIYHFVAGIKHLIMDVGIGESLEGARRLAFLTLGVSAVLILAAGVWIW
ncbi:MAG: succinate dehydrogenase, cytochrome b556 subunit [Pseudomonadales bacterium]|nr:succinate dehydrogenase, cytochrome b556 subunit [Pseudomonadales bacterium]